MAASKTDAPVIDKATKAAARAAAAPKASKAEKEAARRATIKAAAAAIERANLPKDTKLDLDQRKRAAESAAKKAGLTGKALATWILEGKTTAAQVQEAKENREHAGRQERQRSNLTRSNDPEATELAQAAKALAPDVKSAFLPKDARAFIDEILPKGGEDGAAGLLSREVEVTEGEQTKKETASISQAALKRHAIENNKDQDVRAHLTQLAAGTRLWGRKLGLFILAAIQAQAAVKAAKK